MCDRYVLRNGDCLEILRGMPAGSVDSVVTDPPYGIAFMGKRWDYDVPSEAIWAECLRVLKPGGHLLAFAGTRTQHRMAVRIEDAGFEIRDMIAWVYSSGFPKSMNLDRLRGEKICGCQGPGGAPAEREVRSMRHTDVPPPESAGEEQREVLQPSLPQQGAPPDKVQCAAATEGSGKLGVEGWGDLSAQARQLRVGQVYPGSGACSLDDSQGWIRDGAPLDHGVLDRADAPENGSGSPCGSRPAEQCDGEPRIVAGQRQSQAVGAWPVCGGCGLPRIPPGLGTALKPALEPITMARKPLEGTVAANVLAHGTGALNIDGCRVGSVPRTTHADGNQPRDMPGVAGRWPANLIHDGSDEVRATFPEAKGQQGDLTGHASIRQSPNGCFGKMAPALDHLARVETDKSAARFFYCAKASKKDRGDGNKHPTVKPTDLMRYLCRLVTPPGGILLDPFMGSGSTGKAAILEGMRFIGCEMDADYTEIARARIEYAVLAMNESATVAAQTDMFDEVGNA